MRIDDAYRIGSSKFNLEPHMMTKCREVAEEMGVLPQHMGPMMLALAIMGISKAVTQEDLSGELTDALQLVSMAEKEYNMDRKAMH